MIAHTGWMIVLLAAGGQTAEGTARDEVLAAYRATSERGSYEIRTAMTMTQERAGSRMEFSQESEGAWQAPGVARYRTTVRSMRGDLQNPDQVVDMFVREGRVWVKRAADQPWDPVETPPGQEYLQESMVDPLAAARRMVEAAAEVRAGDPADFGGARCRTYVIVLDGAAVGRLLGLEQMMPEGMNLVVERSRMETTVAVAEVDGLVRHATGTSHVEISGGSDPQAMDVRQTFDLSSHGGAHVDVPTDLPR